MAEYLGLTILMHRALSGSIRNGSTSLSRLALAAALSFGYAISDELHQHFIPGRTFQLIDLAGDVAGIGAALTLIMLWKRR